MPFWGLSPPPRGVWEMAKLPMGGAGLGGSRGLPGVEGLAGLQVQALARRAQVVRTGRRALASSWSGGAVSPSSLPSPLSHTALGPSKLPRHQFPLNLHTSPATVEADGVTLFYCGKCDPGSLRHAAGTRDRLVGPCSPARCTSLPARAPALCWPPPLMQCPWWRGWSHQQVPRGTGAAQEGRAHRGLQSSELSLAFCVSSCWLETVSTTVGAGPGFGFPPKVI